MKRRQFIALVCAAVAGLSAAAADQRKRTRRIAVLMGVTVGDSEGQARVKAFQQGLELAGWVEGDNIEIEYRWGAAEPAAFRTHADELVDQRPEVILANTPPAVTALCERTKTIPIVFTGVSSPLEAGIVESLAHPGGNVTGFSTFDPAMGGKWVDILQEIAPALTRIAVMFNPQTATAMSAVLPPIEAAARSITVEVVTIGDANEIEEKIKAFARNHSNGGLIVAPDPFTTTHRAKIVAIVARYNVRTIYPYRWFAVAGGLISYGPDVLDQFRRAGGYVDRILKGEIPRGLPVQAPSKFELVLNLKSAKALGVSFGPLLLASADEVIE